MPRLILMLLILGGASFFILKTLFDFFGGISGTRSAIRKDIEELLAGLRQYELSPWNHDELDLISRKHESQVKKTPLADLEYGIYYSIYQEPILAYAVKEYRNSPKRLVVVRYNEQEYSFVVTGSKVRIVENNQSKGDIELRDGIKVIRGARTLQIQQSTNSELLPVEINGEPMLFIQAEEHAQTDQSRLIQKLKVHDDYEGDLLLLSIAYALADRQV